MKKAMLLTGLIALAFNMFALYLQYIEGFQPCVQCIDIRVGLYGVTLLSLFGVLASKIKAILLYPFYMATIGVFVYTYCLTYDAYLSTKQLFASCDIEPDIAAFIPLHEWIPSVFGVKGMCGEVYWNFMGIDFEIVTMTAISLPILLFILIAPMFGIFNKKK
jgi:disulfide bond formation protein DsbB